MRNIKSKKGKIAIGALVVGFLIIINTILVQKTTYITFLEDQFCVALCEASDRFTEYEISGDNRDFLMGIAGLGICVQLAPQFNINTCVHKNHIDLNKLYAGLYNVPCDDYQYLCPKLIMMCDKLQNNPYDITGYAIVTELVNLIYKR